MTGIRLACLGVMLAVFGTGCGDPPPTDSTGDPSAGPAEPQVACLGVVASMCAEFLNQAVVDGRGVPVSAIRIVCTAAPCTVRQGEVKIDVLYVNGRRNSSGSGWGSVGGGGAPAPMPVLPDAPPNPSG